MTAVSPRKARRLPGNVPRKKRGGIVPGGLKDTDEESSSPLGPHQTESGPDGDWVVRLVPGPSAVKAYRCPGCDQEIPAGTAHIVAWPAETPGLEMRRHWHRACWDRRLHRRPGVRRPR